MSDAQQDIEGTHGGSEAASGPDGGPDDGRQPTPREEEHEATDGARFRAGQDSVEVNDSGLAASRAYGTEGATADDVDRPD